MVSKCPTAWRTEAPWANTNDLRHREWFHPGSSAQADANDKATCHAIRWKRAIQHFGRPSCWTPFGSDVRDPGRCGRTRPWLSDCPPIWRTHRLDEERCRKRGGVRREPWAHVSSRSAACHPDGRGDQVLRSEGAEAASGLCRSNLSPGSSNRGLVAILPADWDALGLTAWLILQG